MNLDWLNPNKSEDLEQVRLEEIFFNAIVKKLSDYKGIYTLEQISGKILASVIVDLCNELDMSVGFVHDQIGYFLTAWNFDTGAQ